MVIIYELHSFVVSLLTSHGRRKKLSHMYKRHFVVHSALVLLIPSNPAIVEGLGSAVNDATPMLAEVVITPPPPVIL